MTKNKLSLAFLSLPFLLLAAGCVNSDAIVSLESDIPAIELKKTQKGYHVDIYLNPRTPIEEKEAINFIVRFRLRKPSPGSNDTIDFETSVEPNKYTIKSVLPPSTIVDSLTGPLNVSGPINKVSFDFNEDQEVTKKIDLLGKAIASGELSGGTIQLDLKTNPQFVYSRSFNFIHRLLPMRTANVAGLQNFNFSEKTGSSAQMNKKLYFPIRVIDTGTYSEESLTRISIQLLKEHFDDIWEKQCGIKLLITDYLYTNNLNYTDENGIHFSQYEDALMSPEWIFLLKLLHKTPQNTLGEKSIRPKAIPVILGPHLAFRKTDSSLGFFGTSTASGIAFSESVRANHFPLFEELLSEIEVQELIVIRDSWVLAHEAGHVMLDQGHDQNPDFLMAASGGNKKSIISEAQCEKARAYVSRLNSENLDESIRPNAVSVSDSKVKGALHLNTEGNGNIVRSALDSQGASVAF